MVAQLVNSQDRTHQGKLGFPQMLCINDVSDVCPKRARCGDNCYRRSESAEIERKAVLAVHQTVTSYLCILLSISLSFISLKK